MSSTRSMLGRDRIDSLGAALALAFAAACSGPAQGTERIAAGDARVFESYVQPYLELRCASLDCHGDAGRPLRLYSELGLRRDDALRSAPIASSRDPDAITPQELDENRLAFAGVATATRDVSSHLALLKPLAVSAGGIAHEGGVHWTSRDALGYRCLRGYLDPDAETDVPTVCAGALAAGLP